MPLLTIFAEPCKNCLYSAERLVAPREAKKIIKETTEAGGYFICHVSTMHDGNETMCAGYYDNHAEHCRKLQLLRQFESELGNDAQLVEFLPQPKTEKLMSHKQIEGLRNA